MTRKRTLQVHLKITNKNLESLMTRLISHLPTHRTKVGSSQHLLVYLPPIKMLMQILNRKNKIKKLKIPHLKSSSLLSLHNSRRMSMMQLKISSIMARRESQSRIAIFSSSQPVTNILKMQPFSRKF